MKRRERACKGSADCVIFIINKMKENAGARWTQVRQIN